MAFNPSIHTATNKPIGLINKPVDARTYYYDAATFSYRPYASTSEVLGYLIGTDRVGHFTVIVGSDEYWFKDGILDADLVKKSSGILLEPIIYNLPSGSETPVIINFSDSSIKIGSAVAVSIGYDLTNYRSNPDGIKFEIIGSEDELQTTPKDPGAWLKKTYTDNTYTELSLATITPDTDTGMEEGVTLDNINIIIKA